MGVLMIVALHLLLQYVKSRDNHTSCARFCLYHLAGAKEKVLEHTELVLVEGIIISVGICILCRAQIKTWQIGDVTNGTAIVVVVVLQFFAGIVVFSQQTLLDNHIHLVSLDVNCRTEAVAKFGKQVLRDVLHGNHIVQLQLGNGNCPGFST